MLDYYIRKYSRNGILLDTNLLLLFLIGAYDIRYIREFKRTCMYDSDDYEWIEIYTGYFSNIFVTPQILAEVWNFAEKIRTDLFSSFFETSVKKLTLLKENYVEKDIILSDYDLRYIGVTDISVIHTAKKTSCLVLTDDLRAYSFFLKNDIDVININHLRQV